MARFPFLRRSSAPPKHRPKPVLSETAAVQGATLLGALSPMAFSDETLPGGEGFLTYRKMQHDPQIKACLSTKKCAVLSRGWEIHPATGSAGDKMIADFCRAQLIGMETSILDVLYDAMDSLALGVSILEMNWRLLDNGMIGLRSIKAKDPSYFLFETDPFLNVTALRGLPLGPRDAPGTGNRETAEGLLPRDKFILCANQPSYANPLGSSDLRAAWQPWFVKQQLMRWWAKYLEKFGLPTIAGAYDPTRGYGVKQQRELLSLLAGVHNESALVYPSDMKVSFLEADRSSDQSFLDAISYLDRSIAKSILGQSLTSDSSDRGSTYALGAVQAHVLSFYLEKLQRDLEESVLNRQALRRLVEYNFPPGSPTPIFRLGRIDDDRLAATSQLIQTLINGGVIAPDESWIRGYLGLPAAAAETTATADN